MIEIPNLTIEEWMADLKPYQRHQMDSLIKLSSEESAVERWLAANGPNFTIQFGGNSNDTKPFYHNFKAEVSKFLCGHEDYEEQRKQLISEGNITKTVLLTIISGAVAIKLGVLMSLIVPAVAVILHLIGKLSIKAWCATNYG